MRVHSHVQDARGVRTDGDPAARQFDDRADDRPAGDGRGPAVTGLVVVCGLPGVGKTTVAGIVAEELDARRFRTDEVRKDLFTDPEYTDEEERRVYGELFDRVRDALDDGERVVVDGTFRRSAFRTRAAGVAAESGVDVRFLRVRCDEAAVRQRMRERTDDASDADFEVHRLYHEKFDDLDRDHVVVDNSGPLQETRARVQELIDRPVTR